MIKILIMAIMDMAINTISLPKKTMFIVFLGIFLAQELVFADESVFIEKSRESAQANVNQALFKTYKITCLNGSGANALAACKKAQSINQSDSDVLRRIKELTPPQKNTPQHSTGADKQSETRQKWIQEKKRQEIEIQKQQELEREKTESQKQKEFIQEKKRKEQEAKRQQIAEIQKTLNKLGLDTGGTSGIVGAKTRAAIESFQQATGGTLKVELDHNYLSTLTAALVKQEEADKQYQKAQDLKNNGDIERALSAINQAIEIAPWNANFASYYSKLSQEKDFTSTQKEDIIKLLTTLDMQASELSELKQRSIKAEENNKELIESAQQTLRNNWPN